MRLRALALALALCAAPAAAQLPSITFEPERPTTLEPIHIKVIVLAPHGRDPNLVFSHVEGEKIVFQVGTFTGQPPPEIPWAVETFVGPLRKGFYTIVVDSDSGLDYQRTFEVTEPSPALGLQESEDSAFTMAVDFEPPPASNLRGTGYGVPLTRESGYVWFFSPENVELTVKILDGRAVNGRWWVFLASMTDVQFTATIQQCPTSPLVGQPCNVKTYTNPKGVNRNVLDVNAFPDL